MIHMNVSMFYVCIELILALPIHQKLAGYTLTHAHTQGHTQGTGHILNFYLSLSHDSNTCSIVLNCDFGENIKILQAGNINYKLL